MIKLNEQLVGTPECTPTVTAGHNAGDRVAQFTVSVTFTCSGEVYDHDAALAMAANLLTQQAATDPGRGYVLVRQITTAITNATADHQGTMSVTVSADGVWAYQFTDAEMQAIARLIAGKSVQEARQVLVSQPGVEKATVQISGFGQMVPSDPSKIKIVVQRA
jgi:VCBS repeat-containing protein